MPPLFFCYQRSGISIYFCLMSKQAKITMKANSCIKDYN